jgi:hypothetical protein
MMDLGDRPGIDLSIEDVAVICGTLGIDPPSGWRSALDTSAPEMHATVVAVVTGGLRARGLLRDGVVHDAVAATLELCSRPRCLVRFRGRHGSAHTSVSVAVDVDAAVVQRDLPGRVCRFTPVPAREVLACLSAMSGLDAVLDVLTPGLPDHDVAIASAEYHRAVDLATMGRVEEAATVFGDALAGLAEAFASPTISGNAVVLHEPAPGVIAGGALTWVVAGGSVWVVPEPDVADPRLPFLAPLDREVVVRRVSVGSLWSELGSYFPSDLPVDAPEVVGAT